MPYKPLWASLVLVALLLAAAPGSLSAQSNVDTLDVALTYVDENAAKLGVTRADVEDLVVTSRYRSSHNGVTHVNLNQHYQGLEVFGGHVTVNVSLDGGVVFAGGSLVAKLGGAPTGSADLKATEAVEAAAEELKLGRPTDLHVISSSGPEAVVSDGGISDATIPLRLGWQPTGSGLRKAWQLVIDHSSSEHLWNATVDAETGALLAADDWTSHDDLNDLAGTLTRPGGAQTSGSSLVTPNPVTDGSSYRIFELPKESPNDGPRTLVENPADATASPFGWHDTNAATGPEFTNARGTNVHAYLDQDDSDAADFGEPDGGPGLDFDFPLDLTQHAQNYRGAAVSNLFYWNNVFHDVTHRYGFNEAAGNFQANNYGNGGTQGDYVRAEAADGGGTENANFATPIETQTSGGTPRMQMYLWPGDEFGAQNQVVVDGLGSFDSSWARFSPAPTAAGTSGHQRRQRLRGRGLRGRSGRRLDRNRDRQQPRVSEHPEGTAGEHGRSEGAHRRPLERRRRSHPDGLVDDGCPDDPCREHHAGRRERDPSRHRGRTDERNRSQASESPRHPRRRPGERDHHPRVRPWRFEPPDGRSWCQLPVRQRAGWRGVERLFRDHSAARPGARRSQPAAWSRPVCALPGRPAWGRHPAAALHARHGDPAVYL